MKYEVTLVERNYKTYDVEAEDEVAACKQAITLFEEGTPPNDEDCSRIEVSEVKPAT